MRLVDYAGRPGPSDEVQVQLSDGTQTEEKAVETTSGKWAANRDLEHDPVGLNKVHSSSMAASGSQRPQMLASTAAIAQEG